jgi:hypothetical protein
MEEDVAPEENPLFLSLQRSLQALLRRAAALHTLTESETATEVDELCSCLEAILQHRFKARQFYMFTVHPWSLIESSESWGTTEAEAVHRAREVGKTDAARLRAWIFVQLNQRSLQLALGALINDQGVRSTFFQERALVQRAECRQLLVDLLRPLSGLSFRLGAAAGLASVAVVADPDLQPRVDSATAEQTVASDQPPLPQSFAPPPPPPPLPSPPENAHEEIAEISTEGRPGDTRATSSQTATADDEAPQQKALSTASLRKEEVGTTTGHEEEKGEQTVCDEGAIAADASGHERDESLAASGDGSAVHSCAGGGIDALVDSCSSSAATAPAAVVPPSSSNASSHRAMPPISGGEAVLSAPGGTTISKENGANADGWQVAVARHGSIRRRACPASKRSIAIISKPTKAAETRAYSSSDPCLAAIMAAASPQPITKANGTCAGASTPNSTSPTTPLRTATARTPPRPAVMNSASATAAEAGSPTESSSVVNPFTVNTGSLSSHVHVALPDVSAASVLDALHATKQSVAYGNPWEGDVPLSTSTPSEEAPAPSATTDDASFFPPQIPQGALSSEAEQLTWAEGLARATAEVDLGANDCAAESSQGVATFSACDTATAPLLRSTGTAISDHPQANSSTQSEQLISDDAGNTDGIARCAPSVESVASDDAQSMSSARSSYDEEDAPAFQQSIFPPGSLMRPAEPQIEPCSSVSTLVSSTASDLHGAPPIRALSPASLSAPPLLSAVVMDYFAADATERCSDSSSSPNLVQAAQSSASTRLAVRTVQLIGHEQRESLPGRRGSFSDSMNNRSRSSSLSGSFSGSSSSLPPLESASGSRKSRSRRMHTVYQLRARVGPFECTSFRRFSDFLQLQSRLQRAAGKGKTARQHLLAATPTARKLRESKLSLASRERQVEQRLRMLQRYCTELCASPQLAQEELVTSFFWPNDGSGSVVAPDGSVASMLNEHETE